MSSDPRFEAEWKLEEAILEYCRAYEIEDAHGTVDAVFEVLEDQETQ